ncbi:MAG TPA: hypothetical protein VN257_07760, partial [Actinotalea sp.]|nr:hypothetical protein [Actinotalea sp.]
MPLSTPALALALAATVVGVAVFSLGVRGIWRTVAVGGPAARGDHPGRRTWLTFTTLLGHGRFRHRPMVRVAHWVVMVSFPILFLTLASAYGQLVDPRFTLPLVGRWAPLEVLTEVIAWLSLVGIVALIVLRQVSHPRRGAAAAGRPSAARTDDDVRHGPPGARASRFFGSNMGQAYLVEAVVLVVVVAVLVLRGLEHALEISPTVGGATQLASPGAALQPFTPGHYPLTAWFGQWFAAWPVERIESAIVLVALAKILASMTWMVVVGLRPAMGVSWHRFLAVVNVWARREVDGRPALGPVPPVRAGGTGGGAV